MKISEINMEIERLEAMVNGKFDNGLHGSIVMKHIKCCKEGCKCEDGYKHGPYPHIQFYDGDGKLRTLYIKKRLVDHYAALLKENNDLRNNIKELVRLYHLRETLIKKN